MLLGLFAGLAAIEGSTSLTLLLALLCSGTSIVQYPMAAVTPYKQALHDKLAHTYVIKSEKPLSTIELMVRALLSVVLSGLIFMSEESKQRTKNKKARTFSGSASVAIPK